MAWPRSAPSAGPDVSAGPYDDQAIDALTALHGYTSQGALTTGDQGRLGRLAPGFLADITVLAEDPVEIAPDYLHPRPRRPDRRRRRGRVPRLDPRGLSGRPRHEAYREPGRPPARRAGRDAAECTRIRVTPRGSGPVLSRRGVLRVAGAQPSSTIQIRTSADGDSAITPGWVSSRSRSAAAGCSGGHARSRTTSARTGSTRASRSASSSPSRSSRSHGLHRGTATPWQRRDGVSIARPCDLPGGPPQLSSNPSVSAIAISCARVFAPVLAIALRTCARTVSGAMCRPAQIRGHLAERDRRTISCSRALAGRRAGACRLLLERSRSNAEDEDGASGAGGAHREVDDAGRAVGPADPAAAERLAAAAPPRARPRRWAPRPGRRAAW